MCGWHTDSGHADAPHTDHADAPPHTDAGPHEDIGTAPSAPHADVAHTDAIHTDGFGSGHPEPHEDIGGSRHVDVLHSDFYHADEYQGNAHIDSPQHGDEPYSDNTPQVGR